MRYKSMIKNHLITLLAITTIFSSFPLTVYGAQDESPAKDEMMEEIETSENNDEIPEEEKSESGEIEEEIEYTEEELLSQDGNIPEGEGDEIDVITDTNKSEENNCQVNIKADIPEGFALDLFVDFKNVENGKTYRLYSLYKNNYSAYIFVPNGSYEIIECGVYGDNINQYPLNKPEDFYIEENAVYTISTSLIKQEEIEDIIEERMNDSEEAEEDNELDVVEFKNDEVYPWRVLTKSAGIEANVTLTGRSEKDGDIIIKIVKTGELNEAEFIYTLDGGETWSNNQLLTRTFSPEKTGLIFNFPDGDTSGQSASWKAVYKEGETIEYRSYIEFDIDEVTSKGSTLYAYQSDTIYQNAEVVVKITKTGTVGEAMFNYSLDGGNTFKEADILTADSYTFEEIPLIIRFTNLAGQYVVNDIFEFKVEGEKIEKDNSYLMYILLGIVGAVLMAAYCWLCSLKEKNSLYQLNPYTPYSVLHPSRAKVKSKSKKK